MISECATMYRRPESEMRRRGRRAHLRNQDLTAHCLVFSVRKHQCSSSPYNGLEVNTGHGRYSRPLLDMKKRSIEVEFKQQQQAKERRIKVHGPRSVDMYKPLDIRRPLTSNDADFFSIPSKSTARKSQSIIAEHRISWSNFRLLD